MYLLTALVIAASVFDVSSSIQYPSAAPSARSLNPAPFILAQEYENDDNKPKPETTSIQLPAQSQEFRDNRRCMTVCSGWGEECVVVDTEADFVTRKCMRTCTSFAEECL